VASEDVSETIAGVWREVLNVDVVGASSVFFADGGDSLDAVIFLQRVNDLLAVELSIEEMFLRPDFASITAMVRERGRLQTDDS
jgi:acyl carrier protein